MTPSDLDSRIRTTIATIAEAAPEPHPFSAITPRPSTRPTERLRSRHTLMALAAGFVIIAVAATIGFAIRTDSDPHSPPTSAASEPHAVSSATDGPVAVRLVLPRDTVRAGESMTGTVRVRNATGQPIRYTYCERAFSLTLEGQRARQIPVELSCAQPGVLPIGDSTFPVTLSTLETFCSNTPQPSKPPPCGPDGSSPPLPPGRYQAQLHYPGRGDEFGPVPPPIPMQILPAQADLADLPSKGTMPFGPGTVDENGQPNLDRIPDYIEQNDNNMNFVGYTKFEALPAPLTMDSPRPVYADDLTTIVGHLYPIPYGYIPVGAPRPDGG